MISAVIESDTVGASASWPAKPSAICRVVNGTSSVLNVGVKYFDNSASASAGQRLVTKIVGFEISLIKHYAILHGFIQSFLPVLV